MGTRVTILEYGGVSPTCSICGARATVRYRDDDRPIVWATCDAHRKLAAIRCGDCRHWAPRGEHENSMGDCGCKQASERGRVLHYCPNYQAAGGKTAE